MNPVHIHLLLNHVPVIGTVIGILLLGYALLRRSQDVTRASLGIFVLAALAGGAVFLTGEPAEERVENLAGISMPILERHEEAALIAALLLAAVGVFALVGLIVFRRREAGIPRGFATVALILALVPAAAMGYTANLGGQIRHSEIRSDAVATTQDARAVQADPRGEDDEHERPQTTPAAIPGR
jgi:hypothetical protein